MSIIEQKRPPLWTALAVLGALVVFFALGFVGNTRAAGWLVGGLAGICLLGVQGYALPLYLRARRRFGRPWPPFEIWRGAAWRRCAEVIGGLEPICQITGKSGQPTFLYWFVITNEHGDWEYAIETCGGGIRGICCHFKSSQSPALSHSWSESGDDFIDCTGSDSWSAAALNAMERAGRPTKHVRLVAPEQEVAKGYLISAYQKMGTPYGSIASSTVTK